MKIFIISFFFYPDNNPRSNRWSALANEFQKENHKLTVFTTSDVPINYSNKIFFKIVKNKFFKKQFINKNKYEKNKYSFKKEIIFFIYRKIIKKLQWPDFSWWWIRPCINYIENEILLEKPDLIISVSHPFSSHVIGFNIKKKYKDINWIMDCGDPFYFNIPLPNNKLLYNLNRSYYITNLLSNYYHNLCNSNKKLCGNLKNYNIEYLYYYPYFNAYNVNVFNYIFNRIYKSFVNFDIEEMINNVPNITEMTNNILIGIPVANENIKLIYEMFP